MKSERGIFIAFILNLFFSVFEAVGGIVTGSVAIVSDAVHDFGDAAAIGISFFLEKKSKKQPDESHTYGYLRYSVLGSLIVTVILICGCVAVALNAVRRIIDPAKINYDGMIAFAVIGAAVNIIGARLTHSGSSLNSKAVSLHLLEDVLGWLVVLIGAVVMKFTGYVLIDPLMSIGVSVFIFVNAVKNLKKVTDIFLEKTPEGISVSELKNELEQIEGVDEVHHIHIRSIDGETVHATMHLVTEADSCEVKRAVKHFLEHKGITHATVETERRYEHCHEKMCTAQATQRSCCHGHQH